MTATMTTGESPVTVLLDSQKPSLLAEVNFVSSASTTQSDITHISAKHETPLTPPNQLSLSASTDFRNPVSSFTPVIDCLFVDFPAIQTLRTICPSLKIYTRSSPSFPVLRTVYQLRDPSTPVAVLRPTSISEIQSIILFATTRQPRLPITVRSGGHDGSGRGSVDGGLVIDMREMDSLELNKETMTVRVGGGVKSHNLVSFLHEHGLVSAVGECSSVGVVNFSTCGGYGFLTGKVGLGVDQVVGATVVDACGVVRDTRDGGEDGRELLWGIRGAGGNFGVIVELELRVYKLERMLAGFLAFKFEEARSVMKGYRVLFENAKRENLNPWGGAWGIFNMPGSGKVLLFMATWSDEDIEHGQQWMNRLRGLGSPIHDTVQETTFKQWLDKCGSIGPTASFQTMQAPYVRELSDSVINAIVHHGELMPDDPACMINIHTCHGRGALPDISASFYQRGHHLIIEILGATTDESPNQQSRVLKWCLEMSMDLRSRGLCLSGGYVNFIEKGYSVESSYGNDGVWERLLALKNRIDPGNVFANAAPSLGTYTKLEVQKREVVYSSASLELFLSQLSAMFTRIILD